MYVAFMSKLTLLPLACQAIMLAAVITESGQSRSTTTVTARGRPFPRGWLKAFPRMEYDNGENYMSWRLCKQCGNKSGASCGTRNFRIKTVTYHVQSAEHRQSVVASDEHQQKVEAGLNAAATKRRNATLLADNREGYKREVQEFSWIPQGMRSRGCRAVESWRKRQP